MTPPVTGRWVFEPVSPPRLPPPPGPASPPPARRRRPPILRASIVTLMAVVTASVVTLVVRSHAKHLEPGPPAPSAVQALAWSVDAGRQAFVAVIALPSGKPPVVLVVPASTLVDIPGGGPTRVGGASGEDPGLMLAAVQATVNRRVSHYLATDATALQALIDRLGGVEVRVATSFRSGAVRIGRGPHRLVGVQVLAYLAGARGSDRTSRWQEVLAGLMAGSSDPWRWAGALGASDDAPTAARILAAARGAQILDLPTAPNIAGGQAPDTESVAGLVIDRMGGLDGPLVRVAVLNGRAGPASAPAISSRLAPAGFRITAAPGRPLPASEGTLILATAREFLPRARQIQSLLGAGKVYVGRPSGIADVLILVGEDFPGN